ncbi:MAG: hypothetical protein PWP15_680 [Methanothermococcus sp.]|uniref:TIGR00267 family protein n=1 Tax=Methanothermococcus sp. TaxID=2614238 RepID=UPI0025872F19|nr:TIGR00267 family protein [Methanothermococcus sp.]MDK2790173.1 hypothetical protein [Methanothermococcus sp.]
MVSLKDTISSFKMGTFDMRYVIRGLIDGSLSTLGVVIGASSGDPSIIIAAGIGGGLANGISNILGALTAERAMLEEQRGLQEKTLLKEDGYLKKTLFYKKALNGTLFSGVIDGISTMVGSIVPVIPFFLFKPTTAILVAILVTLAILFGLGIFIGRLSKENLVLAGLKMVLGGVLVAIVCFAVENMFN